MNPTATMGHGHHPLQVPFDDLRPQDRVECLDLSSSPNQVHWGKYLLCQSFSTATKHGVGVGIDVHVTDPLGSVIIPLFLFNYSAVEDCVLGLNFDDILPPGSFVVLKNPWFKSIDGGTFVLHCDNPAEVELVSRKRVEAKFPDLIWNRQVRNVQQIWGDDDAAAFAKLKGLGNKGFVSKRFSDAIRFYDMALDYCKENREEEVTIISNKSAALLGLGCYNAALKCAEDALEVEPGNEKYNYRKTKALIGLKKYEEARSFLQDKFDQFPSLRKSKDCKNLLDVVKFLSSRQKIGPTESQLLLIRMETLKNDANVPEFTGPLKMSIIEGKGRGLVATEDISTGQLLLCAKAFGYHATTSKQNLAMKSLLETPSEEQIVGKIANKLAFDPELRPLFYNLTAGADLGPLAPGDMEAGHVDMKRLSATVKTNGFRTGKVILKNGEATEFTGIWILPSFFNHSCSEFNCFWSICGEWMMVSAIADIKKGDELTIAYISPIGSYKERLGSVNELGFTCDCSLCQLDVKEPVSIGNEREKILKSLEELSFDCSQAELKKAVKAVGKLVSLRKHNVLLNFPLLSPQIFKLSEILVAKRRLRDSIFVLSRMHEVAAASVFWCTFGKDVTINLLVAYSYKKDHDNVKVWSDNLKALAIKFYGSLEFSDIPFQPLKEQLGIDLLK